MNKKILGIIGARSGSTGLRNKNIKKLGGKPLMAWIINSALKSKYINRLIVSTDSNKYSKIAKNYNAEVPFKRPKKISGNNSNEIDFVKHALNYLKKNENYVPDIIVRMLITVPFQKTKDIDKLIKLILDRKYDSGSIVSKIKIHPKKSLQIIGSKKKYLISYLSKKGVDVGKKLNRQNKKDTDEAYVRSNVLACKIEVIKKHNSLTSNKVGFVKISNDNFVDIDDANDFKYAEYLIKKK